MKMRNYHYETIKAAIAGMPFSIFDSAVISVRVNDKIKDKNFSLRCLVFRLALKNSGNYSDFIYELYEYLKDSHIDTAVKKAFKELGIDNTF